MKKNLVREWMTPNPVTIGPKVTLPEAQKLMKELTLKDGTTVMIRPIRPEDEPLLVKFHEELSDESVYTRYFQLLKLSDRIAHERLTRICFIDYGREMALVAEYTDPPTSFLKITTCRRFAKNRDSNCATIWSSTL